MKKYILNNDNQDLTLYKEDGGVLVIPTNNNSYHLKALKEVEAGEAEIVEYTPPSITWEDIRNERNLLLLASDWINMPDSNPSNKQAWLDYRQVLRDIPQNFTNPEDVIWPQKP